MRRMIVLAVMGLMLAGSAVASAQIIDPTTGVTVDATTDPMDFAAVASGQPGNAGMELAAQATAQAEAAAEEATEQAQEAADEAAEQAQESAEQAAEQTQEMAAQAANPQ